MDGIIKRLSALTMNRISMTVWLSVNSCSHYEQFPVYRYDKQQTRLCTDNL